MSSYGNYSTFLNSYRSMWVMVLFDLPTERSVDRKRAAKFRKTLLNDGFGMFQFSIYMRFCSSLSNAQVHIKRVKNHLPPYGKIGIITITDKQFGDIELFYGRKPMEKESPSQQLELF